jgi:SHS2 domain-containing protein|tara:strand:+ start:24243 stop:24674 length:432 start_codon:yes stop_codon:yes gene_type:complete
MKKYKILEDKAFADICFEAFGKVYNELFENSALAIFEMAADISNFKPNIKKQVSLEADSIENLLYDFLSEILFFKDSEQLLFSDSKVSIQEKENLFSLTAELSGEKINQKKHSLDNDIKAITMHMFKIEKIKQGYKATVVVDI